MGGMIVVKRTAGYGGHGLSAYGGRRRGFVVEVGPVELLLWWADRRYEAGWRDASDAQDELDRMASERDGEGGGGG
jgi:hypothetical protein